MNEENIFEAGDRVWAFGRGWGTVEETQNTPLFPIGVQFDVGGYWITYTFDGKETPHEPRSIFFEELPIPQTALKKKRFPDLNIDAKVWVRSNSESSWRPRHFAGWSGENMLAWTDGKTSHSHTSTQGMMGWKQWKVEGGEK